MTKKIAVVDFETEAIQAAPYYPPKPVGVSIKLPGKMPQYYAWGHPTENTCTRAEAVKVLRETFKTHAILCHHAAFDLEVAYRKLRIKIPKWQDIHDTMFLLYLYEPNARSLSLKPSAHRLLGIEPDDQRDLRDWVVTNIPEAKARPNTWGAYISKAPGKLVGKYANSDTEMTWALFRVFSEEIKSFGMWEAYEVERQLIPIVLRMEREGVNIDRLALHQDSERWIKERTRIQKRIWKRVGGEEFNISSPKQLTTALEKAKIVHPDNWILTEKGNPSTSRKSLEEVVEDRTLLKNLVRFSTLNHMLNNFCLPWLERMNVYDRPRLYPRFHSTRTDADRAIGTRSGRFSSSDPSFQQLNREPEDDTLPFMRKYLLPEEGHVLLCRDYDQQELRILAHIIGGELLEMYRENPRLDLHETVRGLMVGGGELSRSAVKQLNFSIIYGGGAPRVSSVLDIELDEARILKRAHSTSVPGLKSKMKEIQDLARNGEPVITHGGRLYSPIPEKEYVQLNRQIQGSAADHTKRAMVRIAEALHRVSSEARMLIQVHDEIVVTAPKSLWEKADSAFKDAMEFEYFDLTTPTTGKIGPNWGNLRKLR